MKITTLETGTPVDAQSESNDQAKARGEQWGSKLSKAEEVQWPKDVGALHPG